MTASGDPFVPARSPDGRIEVRFSVYEARMSHFVLEPTVVRLRDGAEVLALAGSSWDGGGVAPTFPAPDRVELHLRHYPDGATTYDLAVDVEAERCWLVGAEDTARPAGQALALIEGAHDEHVERTAPESLERGFCPHCGAQLYPGPLHRLGLRREIQCLLCERTWRLPRAGGAG